jgi:flavin-dependent dehydrogenase
MTVDKRADVVVIGAGPVGLGYAMWLKQERPSTRIVVLEERETPGFKIGESLLSPTTRACYSLGFTRPLMRRLFANHAGFQWWYTDGADDQLRSHLDLVGPESFQVDRRVFELAFQALASRAGIVIRTGSHVRIEDCRLGPNHNEVVYETSSGGTATVGARLVVDASGPRSVIPKHLGVWRKPEGHVDANVYWAYFRRNAAPDIPFWGDAPARNLCFPEGWMWFIGLCSWEGSSDDGLRAMIYDVLDRDGPDGAIPTRRELAQTFGCSFEPMVSIGVVPRADRDESLSLPKGERFQYYLDKYPAVQRVMDHFELVESHYGLPPFVGLEGMIHDGRLYAGDGWLAIGDAAMFVNPIFSPGTAAGLYCAYMAMKATLVALRTSDFSAPTFGSYENYVRELFNALASENDVLYRSFAHETSFERAVMLKFVISVKDTVRALNAAQG